MLSELQHPPEASAMLPFVRLCYGAPSTFVWTDDEGVSHLVSQGEGGEQGDPLMPALFALALADGTDVERFRRFRSVCSREVAGGAVTDSGEGRVMRRTCSGL